MRISPPTSESELLTRGYALAGLKLSNLGALTRSKIPTELSKAKGWIGEQLELALGATAQNLAEPDFLELGIELKTIPINAQGQPKETTFVSIVQLNSNLDIKWETSSIYRKLKKVLWIPIEANPEIPIAERRIGTALLWSPDRAEEAILKQDFEELMDMVCLGQLDQISAHFGHWLQIRPKAANSCSLTNGINAEGANMQTLPRGFYLRTQFTSHLLNKHYTQT